ncbi:hypothetical protein [Sphingobium baderi]|nr:hypothetical protein [Sphingobium baderi]
MVNNERWLAKPTSNFEDAFPNIEAIDFEIDNNPWGHYDRLGHHPIRITRVSPKSFVACPNRRCQRGGFNFGDFLANYSYGGKGTLEIENSYPCNGDEGSPAGRKRGQGCMNSFKVKGTITFKP